MSFQKAHIIAQLEREILPLQGYKSAIDNIGFDAGLGRIKYAFPNASFPVGAIHEFFCSGKEDESAACGFIAGIGSSLIKKGGALLWISQSRMIFPPALQQFGIDPTKVIFIESMKERERTWLLEEAFKCEGLSAVVGEMQELSFIASRRFQLAAEQSKVTGFIVRTRPTNLATACVSRWRISSLPSLPGKMPGVGYARWNVELLKVRNGKPGIWQIEWREGRFRHPYKIAAIANEQHRKAG